MVCTLPKAARELAVALDGANAFNDEGQGDVLAENGQGTQRMPAFAASAINDDVSGLEPLLAASPRRH